MFEDDDDSAIIQYNKDLKPLEKLLAGVRRPGDFSTSGALEIPMPKVAIEGVGVLSFPVPEGQVKQLIHQATRAPYGRGEETIHDESVRKVWQLPPDKVRIDGKSWPASFAAILEQVTAGLGCEGATVSAELYKLLVYDPGGFFLAHRDTEKAAGMFGTLVLTLPAPHRGGELIIRHAGREVTVDLGSAEPSEVRFAAFYADCEHEVRPVVEGHRVCLVYNLIQQRLARAKGGTLEAPDHEKHIEAAAKLLGTHLTNRHTPAKIAWLLEHQYSPESLAFAGLKSADAARVNVLAQAAERTDCAVHLGIVHIEESGSAEPNYSTSQDGGWGYHGDEEEEEEGVDFEVVEVLDWRHYIAEWRDRQDQPVDFGEIPLDPGELLPAGALNDEKPDEQRLLEASGNEGATFERSYHRAALVIWPRARYVDVLLQAGVNAALPYLRERIAASDREAAALARTIINAWGGPLSPISAVYRHQDSSQEPNRAQMLGLLIALGDETQLQRFIGGAVTREFDGSENDELAAAAILLGPAQAGPLFAKLIGENMPSFYVACVNLLHDLVARTAGRKTPGSRKEWQACLLEIATLIVEALPHLKPPNRADPGVDWKRSSKIRLATPAMVAELLESLRALGASTLQRQAAEEFTRNQRVFHPAAIIVHALAQLKESRNSLSSDADCHQLWIHAAEFLLARSEQPPAPPADWRQPFNLSCNCEDCRALHLFALDAQAQVGRFRINQGRREHLHWQIKQHDLDMTHVTERQGSPQTLVCTKTRRTYERQCQQHHADTVSMSTLLEVMPAAPDVLSKLTNRLAAASKRTPLA